MKGSWRHAFLGCLLSFVTAFEMIFGIQTVPWTFLNICQNPNHLIFQHHLYRSCLQLMSLTCCQNEWPALLAWHALLDLWQPPRVQMWHNFFFWVFFFFSEPDSSLCHLVILQSLSFYDTFRSRSSPETCGWMSAALDETRGHSS